MISVQQVKKRVTVVRRALARKNVDCLIVTKPANVTYVTGFMGDDSWAVITKRAAYLVTDSRYSEQAGGECPACRIVERTGSIAEAIADLLGNKNVAVVSVENSVSAADLAELRKNVRMRVRPVAGVVEAVRAVKDEVEAALIEKACRIAAGAYSEARRAVRTGMSENELAGVLELRIRRLGGKPAFETIVAFGSHGSRPHHRPGGRKLKAKDSVLMDFGVKWKGYRSDLTRCFEHGGANRRFRQVFEVVERAQAAAIATAGPGVRLQEVDEAARRVIRESGLPLYGHGTGHGLGLEVHEGPVAAARSKGMLVPGNVITIEPAVYIPGRTGIRIEDDVLITAGGCRVLSRSCPH